MDVTVVGIGGALVAVPFTSADNYWLAKQASYAIDFLPDSYKFVASGPTVARTAAAGILGNVAGATPPPAP